MAACILPSRSFEVYRVTHTETGRSYIGCTTQGTKNRLKEHVWNARWKPVSYFHRAISKYGIEAFSVEIIGTANSLIEMMNLEVALIAQFNTMSPSGYNMTSGGEGLVRPAPGVLERIRLAMIGRRLTPGHKAKISKSNTGRIVSDETRSAIKSSRVGMIFSDAHKKSLSAARIGKPLGPRKQPMPESQRLKISEAVARRWLEPTYREKISAAMAGREVSESTRLKIGAKGREIWADPAYKLKMSAIRRESQLLVADRTSDAMKEKWADPAFRASMIEARRIAREKKIKSQQ